jgi:transcriptional antiterminator RfaH
MTETQPIDEREARRVDMEALDGGAEVDESTADWYLVECAPDCDAKAMRWLVRRHFGIFQPIMRVRRERYAGKHGDGTHRMVSVREPAFPGYLFVMVWNIDKTYDHLRTCPGVEGVLLQAGKPWPIPDDFISRLYALDWLDDGSTAGEHVAVSGQRNRRKPRKSNKIKRSCQLTEGLINAGDLAAPERISQLMASLPSISPHSGDPAMAASDR